MGPTYNVKFWMLTESVKALYTLLVYLERAKRTNVFIIKIFFYGDPKEQKTTTKVSNLIN